MAKVYNVNVPMTYGGSTHMHNLKETLKSAGWTVPFSSDGITYFSGSDGITTDAAGAGGIDNNHAWYMIVDPDNRFGFVTQRGTSGGQRYWTLYSFNKYSTFSGSIPSIQTGSITTTPIWSLGPDDAKLGRGVSTEYNIGSGSQLCAHFFDPTESNSQRSHVVAYDTPYNGTYGFYSFCSENGTTIGRTNSMIFLDPLLSGSVPDNNIVPYVIKSAYITGSLTIAGAGLNNNASGVKTIWGPFNVLSSYRFIGTCMMPVDFDNINKTITFVSLPDSFNAVNTSAFVTFVINQYNSQYYNSETPLLSLPWYGSNSGQTRYYGYYCGMPGKVRVTTKGTYSANGTTLNVAGLCFPDTINLATDAYIVVGLSWCLPWPENVVPLT